MWFKISSFFKFLLQAKNKFSIHSPFVFNLITGCFESTIAPSKKETFNIIRKWLIKNQNVITITDFGKGSKVFKSNNRKISDIAKIAAITPKKAFLLIKLIEYLKCNTILEIGTSVGLATATMRIANKTANIKTLEGCNQTAQIAQDLFLKFNLQPIDMVIAEFKQSLPKILENQHYDLIYFDGNHSKNDTLSYFNLCLESAHNNSIFIFDDIYWSKEMFEAWNEIKSNSKVTVSINMYFWGLIFFRKELSKQDFKIKA